MNPMFMQVLQPVRLCRKSTIAELNEIIKLQYLIILIKQFISPTKTMGAGSCYFYNLQFLIFNFQHCQHLLVAHHLKKQLN